MSIRKRSFKQTSLAITLAVCFAAASAGSPAAHDCHGRAGPSKLDYLVLASIADSPDLLAMAAYRPTNH
jgi:hypothetical protein